MNANVECSFKYFHVLIFRFGAEQIKHHFLFFSMSIFLFFSPYLSIFSKSKFFVFFFLSFFSYLQDLTVIVICAQNTYMRVRPIACFDTSGLIMTEKKNWIICFKTLTLHYGSSLILTLSIFCFAYEALSSALEYCLGQCIELTMKMWWSSECYISNIKFF